MIFGSLFNMTFKLEPDFYFNTFYEVNISFLNEQEIKYIFTDVDNTLEPYENPKPGKKVLNWLNELNANGIKVAIVSNNKRGRIDVFNQDLGLIAYSKAKKPFKKYISQAMHEMGAKKENSVFIGDQIFTDVLAAHNVGMRAILVPPIKDKRDFFTKFKRLLEKPILHKFLKKQNKAGHREREDK